MLWYVIGAQEYRNGISWTKQETRIKYGLLTFTEMKQLLWNKCTVPVKSSFYFNVYVKNCFPEMTMKLRIVMKSFFMRFVCGETLESGTLQKYCGKIATKIIIGSSSDCSYSTRGGLMPALDCGKCNCWSFSVSEWRNGDLWDKLTRRAQ